MDILKFIYSTNDNSLGIEIVTGDSGSLYFVLSGEACFPDPRKAVIERDFRNAFNTCDSISDLIRYMRLRGYGIETNTKPE